MWNGSETDLWQPLFELFSHNVYEYNTAYCVCVLGLQCPHHNNPADFIVDKIMDHEQEADVAHGKVMVVALCDYDPLVASCDPMIISGPIVA